MNGTLLSPISITLVFSLLRKRFLNAEPLLGAVSTRVPSDWTVLFLCLRLRTEKSGSSSPPLLFFIISTLKAWIRGVGKEHTYLATFDTSRKYFYINSQKNLLEWCKNWISAFFVCFFNIIFTTSIHRSGFFLYHGPECFSTSHGLARKRLS